MAVGFDCPMAQAAINNPLVWALWLLLWLCSQDVGGFTGSDILEDVILTQLGVRLLSRTSAWVNKVRGSMAYWSSSTLFNSWWGLPGVGGWAFSAHIGGPWHKPGSFDAASADRPDCQISCPGVAGTDPCPGTGVLMAKSNHSLLWRCGILLLVSEKVPAPSGWIP